MPKVINAQVKEIVAGLSDWKRGPDLPRGAFGLNILLTHRQGPNAVLKILDPNANIRKNFDSDTLQRRFLRELSILAQVNSEYIPKVYAGDPVAEPPWYVMKYIPGEDINTLVKNSGKINPQLWFEIAHDILWGLADAHDLLYVHNDLNPGNVRVSIGGKHQLLDFGIAKRVGDKGQQVQNSMGGWAAFMAPEQLPANGVVPLISTKSDIFTFGTLLYYAGTGREPDKQFMLALLSGRAEYTGLSTEQLETLRLMHELDPDNRPSAAELLPLVRKHCPSRAGMVREAVTLVKAPFLSAPPPQVTAASATRSPQPTQHHRALPYELVRRYRDSVLKGSTISAVQTLRQLIPAASLSHATAAVREAGADLERAVAIVERLRREDRNLVPKSRNPAQDSKKSNGSNARKWEEIHPES